MYVCAFKRGIEVTGDFEQPDVGAGNLGPVWEQHILFNINPFLQPNLLFLQYIHVVVCASTSLCFVINDM